jgi:hypothetical protein
VRIARSGRSREKLERTRAALPRNAHEWPLVVADAERRRSSRRAGRVRQGGRVDGGALRAIRPAAGRGLCAGGHALRRSDGRSPVRPGGHRPLRRIGAYIRRPDRALVRVRLDPVRPWHADSSRVCGRELADVRLVATVKGGFSGGTVASLRGQMEAMRGDPAARRMAADPHAFSPDRMAEPAPVQPADAALPGRLPDGTWAAPFVMAPHTRGSCGAAMRSWTGPMAAGCATAR